MTTIRIKTRGNEDEKLLTDVGIITIHDIKRKINESDPSSVLLTFKDKVLLDSTDISTLGEDCTFVIEKDIEFSQIYGHSPKKYRAKINDKYVILKEEEVFFKDGKSFLVTKKLKKIKLVDILDAIRKNFTRIHAIHILFITFVFASRNYPLISTIVFINILKLASQMILKFRIWEKIGTGILYSIFMFFASFIAIDHNRFIPKAIESKPNSSQLAHQ